MDKELPVEQHAHVSIPTEQLRDVTEQVRSLLAVELGFARNQDTLEKMREGISLAHSKTLDILCTLSQMAYAGADQPHGGRTENNAHFLSSRRRVK